jgi:hypothetical protein
VAAVVRDGLGGALKDWLAERVREGRVDVFAVALRWIGAGAEVGEEKKGAASARARERSSRAREGSRTRGFPSRRSRRPTARHFPPAVILPP